MRWLRWMAMLIFLFLSAVFIPFAIKSPIWQNVIPALIVVIVLVWVISGFFKKKIISS